MKKQTLFIVDDEPERLELMQESLEDQFDVFTFGSGGTVLEAGENGVPDLIILDVSMPGIDRYETCKYIRVLDSQSHTLIIFISAHNSIEDRLKAYDSEIKDYKSGLSITCREEKGTCFDISRPMTDKIM